MSAKSESGNKNGIRSWNGSGSGGRGWSGGRRGRGGGGSFNGTAERKPWRGSRQAVATADQDNTPPLGPAIDSIKVKALLVSESAPTIENINYVSSYNWLGKTSPRILVPGSPPAWTPPVAAGPIKLKPDSEPVFRDINAARHPSYPMEPTIRAVRAMQPKYDFQSLDVVGCGSTFGNLMRCASSQPRPFRFDIDVVGETLFLVRREKSPLEQITDLRGYGHTFPEAHTSWDAEVGGSCSHQRIIDYDFGGLHLLVRTETDAYVKEPQSTSAAVKSSTMQTTFEDALGEISLSSHNFTLQSSISDQKLQLTMKGSLVDQAQIFDIKTRASYAPYDMNEILPRLWLNQTSKFLIAYHDHGCFDDPKVKDVKQDVLQWQLANTSLLARFHALIKRIIDAASDANTQQLEVSWDGQGPLCITEQIGKKRKALPSDLSELWETTQ